MVQKIICSKTQFYRGKNVNRFENISIEDACQPSETILCYTFANPHTNGIWRFEGSSKIHLAGISSSQVGPKVEKQLQNAFWAPKSVLGPKNHPSDQANYCLKCTWVILVEKVLPRSHFCVLERFGRFWSVLEGFGLLWNILETLSDIE